MAAKTAKKAVKKTAPAPSRAPALTGPTAARTPAKNKGLAAAHAASVARMAEGAKVSKVTTGAMVKTKGLKFEEPSVKIDQAPQTHKPIKGTATQVEVREKKSTKLKGPVLGHKPTELDIKAARARSMAELEEEFEAFFAAEIEAELEREADIFNDRMAHWRCQCCDALLKIPRRTTVFHGEYVLEHDDLRGLLVNGERFVPKATDATELKQPGRIKVAATPVEVYTPEVEVKQPGRFKDPYRNLR